MSGGAVGLLAVFGLLLAGACIYYVRVLIKAEVQGGVDRGLESLRSQLRAQESQVIAFREAVLSGRQQRQARLYERQMLAVERLWAAVIAYLPYESVALSMFALNYDYVAGKVKSDENMRIFVSELLRPVDGVQEPYKTGLLERPFINETAWAFYSAYQTVLHVSHAYATMLKNGMGDADKYFKSDEIRRILKIALPHQADFIDESHPLAYQAVINELRDKTLENLRSMLDGPSREHADIAQTTAIVQAVKAAQSSLDSASVDFR